jgi:putative peptidoglycan lipid II flippase
VRRILSLMAPRTAGLAVTQVNLVIMLAIASTLSVGSVAVMNLATNLQTVPVGIIAISFAVAAFPPLARNATSGDKAGFKHVLGSTSRKIVFLILPVTAAFLILRAQTVRLILGEGAFDWDDTIRTADVLAIMASSLLAQSLVPLLARAFSALQVTWTPLWAGLVAEAVNVILALVLREPFGILGLAAAFSISAWVSLFLLWALLYRKQGSVGTRDVWNSFWRTFIATLAFCAAAIPVRIWVGTVFPLRNAWQVALQAGLAGLAGLFAFIAIAALLKSPELREFKDAAARKLWKKARVLEGVEQAQGL